jgi:hypothetical protein
MAAVGLGSGAAVGIALVDVDVTIGMAWVELGNGAAVRFTSFPLQAASRIMSISAANQVQAGLPRMAENLALMFPPYFFAAKNGLYFYIFCKMWTSPLLLQKRSYTIKKRPA